MSGAPSEERSASVVPGATRSPVACRARPWRVRRAAPAIRLKFVKAPQVATHRAKVRLMFLIWLAACTQTDCETGSASQRAACFYAVCETFVGQEREVCLARQVESRIHPVDVVRVVARMDDAVLRDTAVLNWSAAHRNLATPAEAEALCAILVSSGERDACRRRLSTPHLQ